MPSVSWLVGTALVGIEILVVSEVFVEVFLLGCISEVMIFVLAVFSCSMFVASVGPHLRLWSFILWE